MKKAVKAIVVLILFIVVLPSLAGVAVMALWNAVVVPVCGFAAIGLLQGVGLFLLGQILTGGCLLALFLVGGGIHAAGHHRGEMRGRWHAMTDDERREFIERRRHKHFTFRTRKAPAENEAE